MTVKVLVADPERCTGCKLCEIACSLKQTGVINPLRSRIQIVNYKNKNFYLPVSCQHCEDAPCMAACPKEAISCETGSERVVVNYDLCVGCRMCVAACPFGAMGFEADYKRVFKCNFCDGDPQCVRFCKPGALRFVDNRMIQYPKKQVSALKYTGIRRKTAV